MRSLTAAVVFGIMVAVVPFHGAAAEDEVLLPQDSQPGHTPEQSTPSGEYTPVPTPTPAAPQTAAPPLPQLPVGASIPPPNVATSPAYPAAIPTKVIKVPVMSSSLPVSGANSISISVADKWGGAYIDQVSQKLGIPKDKVSSLCHVSAGGALVTDKTPFPFDTVEGQSTTGHYDGKLTSLMIATRALCDSSAPLPPNSGMVIQYGNKYAVMLGGGSCTVPAGTVPSQTVIGSTENGSPQCSFK